MSDDAATLPGVPDDPPGWDGNLRTDGARVTVWGRENLGIITVQAPPGRAFLPHGFLREPRPVLALCPCCGLPFKDVQGAKLIANILCPVVA